MEDLLKNKLFWVVAIVTLMNMSFFVIGKIVIDKATDSVIERLEKDYSPSPYGPGFDPDKVDVVIQLDDQVYERATSREMSDMIDDADRWRVSWEKERGANP